MRRALTELRSQDQQAAKFAQVEAFDNFAPMRNGIRRAAELNGEWAGIPMPLQHHRLVIEPKFANGKELAEIGQEPLPVAPPENARLVNEWWSDRLRAHVVIYEEDGKRCFGTIPVPHLFANSMGALGASVAWGIEQEAAAVQTLAGLVRHHQMKQYLLTGMFLESSPQSGLTYLFRKLRPTVVLNARDKSRSDCRILAALCMHPIAFYEGTWAGAMTPTDDVVAMLMLMRGDEHMLWRRCNQHPPTRPEAAL